MVAIPTSNRPDEPAAKAAQETIDEVRKSAVKAFSPLFQRLHDHLADQQERIAALQAQLLSAPVQAASIATPIKEKLTVVACPTLEWLKANHKGKGTQIKGYTVFCMIYQNVHGSFPGEGVWKKNMSDAEKKPWNDVAKAYSEFRQAGVSTVPVAHMAAPVVAAPSLNPLVGMTPQMLQQAMLLMAQAQTVPVTPAVVLSDARSAYNLWTSDWKKRPENKDKIFPPKDMWKNLPADEKAKYETQFAALKAARAAQKA